MSEWMPIETAPLRRYPMFVVRAFNVVVLDDLPYTTDPYCVWSEGNGHFARWPHKFKPTHWCELPEPPEVKK